ncbi:hypothetical protein PsyrCH409_00175 [Pseudomonas viridiflava]|nr:hypothetical protein PsyrCH409_00175 [Pseudomonas viridiflava]
MHNDECIPAGVDADRDGLDVWHGNVELIDGARSGFQLVSRQPIHMKDDMKLKIIFNFTAMWFDSLRGASLP